MLGSLPERRKTVLNLQEIWEAFALMAQRGEEEREAWLSLCAAAANDLQAELRSPDISPADSRRVNRAAAALAYYRYCLYAAGAEAQSFQAGDVRITNAGNSAIAPAYDAWRQARSRIAPLLQDREFVFSQVSL